MKRKIIGIIAAVLFVLLLIPIRVSYKDGGSVGYKAVLYEVRKVHQFNEPEGFRDGLKIEVLGQTIYEKYEQ